MGEGIKRGEIRCHKFKSPDKNQSVLILTRDSMIEHLAEVTLVPLTSTAREIASEVI